jgi:hypothetical protein
MQSHGFVSGVGTVLSHEKHPDPLKALYLFLYTEEAYHPVFRIVEGDGFMSAQEFADLVRRRVYFDGRMEPCSVPTRGILTIYPDPTDQTEHAHRMSCDFQSASLVKQLSRRDALRPSKPNSAVTSAASPMIYPFTSPEPEPFDDVHFTP